MTPHVYSDSVLHQTVTRNSSSVVKVIKISSRWKTSSALIPRNLYGTICITQYQVLSLSSMFDDEWIYQIEKLHI